MAMGFDLDMTRGYGYNRSRIKQISAKRRFMRELYLKDLEKKNYSYYSDTIPHEVVEEVKGRIRKNYTVMRTRLWIKTWAVFILISFLLILLFYLLTRL